MSAGDLYEQLRRIRYDLTAAQGKLTDAFAMLDALHLEDRRPGCPHCGYRSAPNLPSVAEHIADKHPDAARDASFSRVHNAPPEELER